MSLCTPSLDATLRNALLDLEFPALLEIISMLLERMGYADVTVSARSAVKGRHRDAGYDLSAYRVVPDGRRLVVVQVKQCLFDRLIFKRTLDELRGVALREGAAEGLIITLSGFSKSVPVQAYASASTVPLRFIDGKQLTGQMALYRIGAYKSRSVEVTPTGRYRYDREFFRTLNQKHLRYRFGKRGRPSTTEIWVRARRIRI